MPRSIKLIVFDYPKYLPNNNDTTQVLTDLIQTKQECYERSDSRFVSISGLDFVGTHLMIYDIENVFQPRLILSVRNLFENRINFHNLAMPTNDYLPELDSNAQAAFVKFKSNKHIFVESGALYVNEEYSFKKTNIPYVEIGMMMIVNHLIKSEAYHFAAATNATFKSMRWVAPMGYFEKPFVFNHPLIRHPHELILMDSFNYNWLYQMHEKYFSLWENRLELKPESKYAGSYIKSDVELRKFVANQLQMSATA